MCYKDIHVANLSPVNDEWMKKQQYLEKEKNWHKPWQNTLAVKEKDDIQDEVYIRLCNSFGETLWS